MFVRLRSLARRLRLVFSDEKTAKERLVERNRQLKRLRQRLEAQNRELAALRTKAERGADVTAAFSGDSRQTPVFFVVGRAKSGTSWLMRIFNAHPEILCRGEGRFFGRNFLREDLRAAAGGRLPPSSLHRALLEADLLKEWMRRSVWSRGENTDEHLVNLTRLTTYYFLAQKLAGSGKKIVGDKTPLAEPGNVEEIGEVYPQAKVIHIIRDGRDVAVSTIHHVWNNALQDGGIYALQPEELERREAYRRGEKMGLFTEKAIRRIVTGWRDVVTRSRQDGSRVLGENYIEVRYEDLLERPVEETRRLLAFLGANTDEEVAKQCIDSASFETWTKGRKRGEEKSTAFLRKGVAGDWEGVFTEEDRRIFKEVAGDLLVELGYEKDHDW